jgi:hypothetical protein
LRFGFEMLRAWSLKTRSLKPARPRSGEITGGSLDLQSIRSTIELALPRRQQIVMVPARTEPDENLYPRRLP